MVNINCTCILNSTPQLDILLMSEDKLKWLQKRSLRIGKENLWKTAERSLVTNLWLFVTIKVERSSGKVYSTSYKYFIHAFFRIHMLRLYANWLLILASINHLKTELNPSAQHCLPKFLLGILIFKGLTARRRYKSIVVKWLKIIILQKLERIFTTIFFCVRKYEY
jgi:hypothetical protein